MLYLTKMCVCIHRCVYLSMCWAVKGICIVVEMCQAGHLAKSCSLMVSSLVWVPLGAAHHFPSGLWWYVFLRPNYCLLWPCVHAVSETQLLSVLCVQIYLCTGIHTHTHQIWPKCMSISMWCRGFYDNFFFFGPTFLFQCNLSALLSLAVYLVFFNN